MMINFHNFQFKFEFLIEKLGNSQILGSIGLFLVSNHRPKDNSFLMYSKLV